MGELHRNGPEPVSPGKRVSGFDAELLESSEGRQLQSRLELWRSITASPTEVSQDLRLVASAQGTTIRIRRLERRQLGAAVFMSIAGGGPWLAQARVDIKDDLGTEYLLVMTQASGSGLQARGEVWFAPAVPSDAQVLRIRFAGPEEGASAPWPHKQEPKDAEWQFEITLAHNPAAPGT